LAKKTKPTTRETNNSNNTIAHSKAPKNYILIPFLKTGISFDTLLANEMK
jgi:hypothetical protein